MKKTILTLLSVLFCAITFAQNVPQGINYQAIARDAAGAELANDTLIVQFSVLEGAAISWQEIDTVTTNEFGLFTTIIGGGTSTSNGSSSTFDLVDWGAAAHSLKVEIDYGNGLVDMGTTEFMSVPYSLHAKTAANADSTDELQTLTFSGDTIFLSGDLDSNFIVLPSPTLLGCTDPTASNYNASADINDGSCIIIGCTDATALNYNPLAHTEDSTCCYINGCTDTTALNYNPNACLEDSSCIEEVMAVNGCTDSTALNYNPNANIDDSSCISVINGCTDSIALNYNASANADDGSCVYSIGDFYQGGVIIYLNGNGGGLISDIHDIFHPIIPNYPAYNMHAHWGCRSGPSISTDYSIGKGAQNTINILNGCAESDIAAEVCNNSTAQGYSDWFLPSKDELNQIYINQTIINATSTDNGGDTLFVSGQYWSSSENKQTWDTTRAVSQSMWSGIQPLVYKSYNKHVRAIRAFGNMQIYGCTDSISCNFNTLANIDDSSCTLSTSGCTDSVAINYDSLATCDNGACLYPGCIDSIAANYNTNANIDDGSCIIYGCIDSTAFNFDPLANTDDSSCIAVVNGCTDSLACNYDTLANTNDSACILPDGCTNPAAFNYDVTAICDDGSCASAIGDFYQGGVIFYLDGFGGGLVLDIYNSYQARWGCEGTSISTGDSIGTGSQNTINILKGCAEPGIAAEVCNNSTVQGYSDWFLGSKDEMDQIYSNLTIIDSSVIANGGVSFGIASWSSLWTSTELCALTLYTNCSDMAYYSDISPSSNNYASKDYYRNVRAVRAFGNITIYGCTDSTAFNYNPIANTNDNSCVACVNGCTDTDALNYDPAAIVDDGSCIVIGDFYQGGVIFYLDGFGGGLISDIQDAGTAEWGCFGTLLGNPETEIRTGMQNTVNILNECSEPIIAAQLCENSTAQGYTDWYLPSKDELNHIYLSQTIINATSTANGGGVFDSSGYWSSSESGNNYAWRQYFSNGYKNSGNKVNTNGVRAIRAFGSFNTSVYGCTDNTSANYNPNANIDNGTCNPLAIGDFAHGGVVFYIDAITGGGLICDVQSPGGLSWGCSAESVDSAIGTGMHNTITIQALCSTSAMATYFCANSTAQGYTDWYLPSKDELNQMYLNKNIINATSTANGGISMNGYGSSSSTTYNYWSSTSQIILNYGYNPEYGVWTKNFSNGYGQYILPQGSTNLLVGVRAIRAFGNLTIYGCTDSAATNYNSTANTDNGSCTFSSSLAIGDTLQGGIVFYLDGNGGGLIAASSDQSSGAEWGCSPSNLYGADGTAIGTGYQNTIDIEAGCTTPGIAADICWNLTLNGYSDWFLPSKDELNEMYLNIGQGNALGLGNIGGLSSNYYWSSSEGDHPNSWCQNLGNGVQGTFPTYNTYSVRAVRAF